MISISTVCKEFVLIPFVYSLERIQDYIDIDHEPSPTEQGNPPAAWPTSGQIVVDNLSARYSQVWSGCGRSLEFCLNWFRPDPPFYIICPSALSLANVLAWVSNGWQL